MQKKYLEPKMGLRRVVLSLLYSGLTNFWTFFWSIFETNHIHKALLCISAIQQHLCHFFVACRGLFVS